MNTYDKNTVIEMHKAIQEFVDRVDCGMPQRSKVYHKFRDILKKLPPLQEASPLDVYKQSGQR